ncbi:biotin-dependent carboxyltransferase family protein [Polaribacter sp.]|uniref:5-oxoprolinase subunit C family protein n=1 Tax=Polaribacter sp. TaxID=1920175 RepID=UPI003F6CF643
MIKVLKAGFYSSIQDKGRFGFASRGIPFSGVMDAVSADLANAILNNSPDCAVLEICFGNCSFQFLTTTYISISGANFSPTINGTVVKMNQLLTINKNDILSFGKPKFGARTYVAVKEGFQTKKAFNSRSFFKHITDQTILKNGDLLPIPSFKTNKAKTNTVVKIKTNHFKDESLQATEGPEFYLLNHYQKKELLEKNFTISKDHNRMGFRLNESIENELPSILTSAVLPGTVQLTPSGKLIVLMRDCQVTGGYPRILQLKDNAISKLAQKSLSQKIKFLF